MLIYLVFHGILLIFAWNQYLFPWKNNEVFLMEGKKQKKLYFLEYNIRKRPTSTLLITMLMPHLFLYLFKSNGMVIRGLFDTMEIVRIDQHKNNVYRVGKHYYYKDKKYKDLMKIVREFFNK